MSKLTVTLLSGYTKELGTEYRVIDANKEEDITNLFNYNTYKKIDRNNGGEPFGTHNKIKIDRKTGDLSLYRKDECLFDNCEKIIPLKKKNNISYINTYIKQQGIIYIEKIENDNFFYIYKMTKDKYQSFKTKYCVFNELTGNIIPIKNYTYEQNKMLNKKTIEEKIINYLNSIENPFTLNLIKEKLLDMKIITVKDISILITIIDNMYKTGELEYTKTDDLSICYKRKIRK